MVVANRELFYDGCRPQLHSHCAQPSAMEDDNATHHFALQDSVATAWNTMFQNASFNNRFIAPGVAGMQVLLEANKIAITSAEIQEIYNRHGWDNERSFTRHDFFAFMSMVAVRKFSSRHRSENVRGRMRNAATSSSMTVAAIKNVVDVCVRDYLLDAAEVCVVECVCSGTLLSEPMSFIIDTWLSSHPEHGVVDPAMNYIVKYRMYHSSRLTRCFMREIQQNSTSAVVAGSFVTALYARMFDRITWAPNDMDVFVTSYEDYVRVDDLFMKKIAVAGRQSLTRTTSTGRACSSSFLRPYEDTSESSPAGGESGDDTITWSDSTLTPDEDDGSEIFGRDPMIPVRNSTSWVWSAGVPSSSVADWIASLSTSRKAHMYVGEQMSGAEDTNIAAVMQELVRTVNHLPALKTRRKYDLRRTCRISCDCPPGTAPSFTPLNIIQVSWTEPHYGEFNTAQGIIEGFDIVPCCIAVTVDSEDRCIFQDAHGARMAIRSKTMACTTLAFQNRIAPVGVQMTRILKYLQRGFRWPV